MGVEHFGIFEAKRGLDEDVAHGRVWIPVWIFSGISQLFLLPSWCPCDCCFECLLKPFVNVMQFELVAEGNFTLGSLVQQLLSTIQLTGKTNTAKEKVILNNLPRAYYISMKINNKNTYPSMIIASNVVSPSSLGL